MKTLVLAIVLVACAAFIAMAVMGESMLFLVGVLIAAAVWSAVEFLGLFASTNPDTSNVLVFEHGIVLARPLERPVFIEWRGFESYWVHDVEDGFKGRQRQIALHVREQVRRAVPPDIILGASLMNPSAAWEVISRNIAAGPPSLPEEGHWWL